jgi:hypothetical protein
VHEQEVRRIGFKPHLVGNARGHRHGGDAGGADQRIDGVFREPAHQASHEAAGGGSAHEGDQAQGDNAERLECQELLTGQLGADRESEKDGHDVDQGVRHGVGETRHRGTDFAGQVAEHQGSHQRHGAGKQQRAENQHNQREADLLHAGDMTELLHHDGALFFRDDRLHDGRLDDRHERHVGVGGHSHAAENLRGQLGCQPDGRRTVGAADDADGGGFAQTETDAGDGAQQQRAEESDENAELRRGAEQGGAGVGDQRTKVGHGADAHENQDREKTGLHAEFEEVVEIAARLQNAGGHGRHAVDHGADHFHVRGLGDVGIGHVGQQSAEADGQQQKRFKALDNREIDKTEADDDHEQLAHAVGNCAAQNFDRMTRNELAARFVIALLEIFGRVGFEEALDAGGGKEILNLFQCVAPVGAGSLRRSGIQGAAALSAGRRLFGSLGEAEHQSRREGQDCFFHVSVPKGVSSRRKTLSGSVAAGSDDGHQQIAGVDFIALAGMHGFDCAVARGLDGGFHLHHVERQKLVALMNAVAVADADAQNRSRNRGFDLALEELDALLLAGGGDKDILVAQIADAVVGEHLLRGRDALLGVAVVDVDGLLGGRLKPELLGGEFDDLRVRRAGGLPK